MAQKETSRGRKVADLIQRELAVLIQREIKDPRIGMVTINEAKVSRDLAFADIYFTVLPVGDDVTQVEELLNQAGGFLRKQLARVLSTRTTPRLRFHYDTTIETGARLSKAIDEAIAEDEQRHPSESQEPGLKDDQHG